MATHFLPVYRNNASYELDRLQEHIVSFKAAHACCRQYRIRAICTLFMYGVAKEFMADIQGSGRAFLKYLQEQDLREDEGYALSKSTPFFDAIAAQDFDCATGIAQYIDFTWKPDLEYEDDFLYVQFLMQHFFLKADASVCRMTLEKYEKILDGEPDPHFDICMAFINDDSDAFAIAMSGFLENYESYYQLLADTESLLPELLETEGCLSIEGLALLNLAETKGFKLEKDYLFIPSVCRENVAQVAY